MTVASSYIYATYANENATVKAFGEMIGETSFIELQAMPRRRRKRRRRRRRSRRRSVEELTCMA